MCWMSIYRGDNPAARAVAACQQNEQRSGGHSWGVAVAVDGELHRERGLGAMPDDVVDELPDADVALAHTRYATRGEITVQNAHPFEVRDDDGEPVAMMAHNGTWWSAPDDPDRADSYYMARLLESIYRADPGRPFEEIVQATGDTTGETMTVLHRDGSAYVYSGRYEITEAEQCVRSSGATPIPEGTVTEI
ncbi:glutamine amidotransferase domain protein, class-II [Halobacterium phage ChaoS9]|uniref:Glutamine amidotransferase domain protein, class-II n=1 Tax=Halobacterium phage ChaoS9 TaxID=2847105 RepID=A0A481V8F0_9CAUD|nr:glutamine amidotransferase domain protein, class-II [Halobacterium phage ChaoS9]QBI90048.1 glutamine amidotransferase domain protein, class-II [Halobacterium phage ChaoS9]